uniref:Tr-type G domain-containing protein n=1 Tax=Plectus sambesii TaxID=2011161 RepID=A0A914UJG6_9BILA
MARHRNFHNIDLDDERDDDYSYGRSVEEDNAPMSPTTAQFIYRRRRLTSSTSGGTKLSEFISEEDAADYAADYALDYDDALEAEAAGRISDHQPMFHLDDDQAAGPTSSAINPFFPPGLEPRLAASASTPVAVSTPVTVSTPASVGKRRPQEGESSAVSSSKADSSARATNLPLEHLKIADKTPTRHNSKSPSRTGKQQQPNVLTPNSSSQRLTQLPNSSSTPTFSSRTLRRPTGTKPMINMVVVGHVDAGKSTLMGHMLYLLGAVDQRTIHKYKQESQRSGKASFAFAWVLDETEEERERGVTMDIAKTTFDTDSKHVVLLDAPGHKDFIPNMITGAAQADAGLLVVNATRGEFETGFDQGGQTREHAMLLRSLGVAQLAVAVNKLDTIEWSQERFDAISET